MDAAQFASVQNVRKIEQKCIAKLAANTRLKPGDAKDPSSFKVCPVKVSGCRNNLTEEQAEVIGTKMRERLDPVSGDN